jgi:hypothetical protein
VSAVNGFVQQQRTLMLSNKLSDRASYDRASYDRACYDRASYEIILRASFKFLISKLYCIDKKIKHGVNCKFSMAR